MIEKSTTSTSPMPMLRSVDSDMPESGCKCWVMRWSNDDYDAVEASARSTLSKAEYVQGLNKGDTAQTLQHWCSRLTVRQSLSEYVNFSCAPSAWDLVKLPSGKLALANSPTTEQQIDFSMSHTEGLAVCTVTTGAAVGVDIERANRRFRRETIVSGNTFSNSEVRLLKMLSARRRNELALRMWTLKEAASKTIGLGLQLDFSDLQFRVSANGDCEVDQITTAKPLHDWKVSNQLIEDDYFLSIAIATPLSAAARSPLLGA